MLASSNDGWNFEAEFLWSLVEILRLKFVQYLVEILRLIFDHAITML